MAAFRMGHSMIRQVLTRSDINQTYGGGADGGHNILMRIILNQVFFNLIWLTSIFIFIFYISKNIN